SQRTPQSIGHTLSARGGASSIPLAPGIRGPPFRGGLANGERIYPRLWAVYVLRPQVPANAPRTKTPSLASTTCRARHPGHTIPGSAVPCARSQSGERAELTRVIFSRVRRAFA